MPSGAKCGWAWMNNVRHYCYRPAGHKGQHMCACGTYGMVTND